ncbi:hypothetical protein PSQ90_02640 [Devosia rhodophyticola]|uniref:FAD-binding domain-containing protein n=1 Tax=Devosia rhodophyticola TaxID=3026423 RepID=A0ABY7YZR9_9HYPH|nr:hypothetical protein [Devosia rhodophyticola]WDR06384.1 hypothetical protein PSQ90_02640 [Devosia rhodophyticola]
MSGLDVDIAIVGTSPLALLLAAILAGTHKQKIALIGQRPSPFALFDKLTLSVAPLTRPESWSMLAAGVPETEKLIGHLGAKASLLRVDPIFSANSADGEQGLSHIRHMARGFGHMVERVSLDGRACQAIQWRDAIWMDQNALAASVLSWLDQNKVPQYANATLAGRRDGQGRAVFNAKGRQITARLAVLADANAILANLAPNVLQAHFRSATGTSILTQPAGPLASSVLIEIDSGVQLSQGASGGIAATSPLSPEMALPQLAHLLRAHRHLQLAGQDQFTHLTPRYGAPLIGALTPTGPTVLAGLDLIAPFMAPAIARYLLGNTSEAETAYFAVRGANAAMEIKDFARVGAA